MKFMPFVHRLGAAATVAFFLTCSFAQEQPPPPGGGGTPPGGGPTTGGPTGPGGAGPTGPGTGLPGQGRQPTNPFPGDPNDPRQRSPFPDMGARPIFLSGKVVLDDGTPPPEPVVIERVCNGQPRPEAYTDSKGRFSFQLGQNNQMFADASVGAANDTFGDFSNNSRTPGIGGQRQISERDLMGCEIRASLPGYRSEAVPLSGRRVMDNPDIGTIILRRLGNVEGLTVSVTSAAAPKDAKKAFEKGRDHARKRKWADAQKEYEKAVALYPKYANAWVDLGMVYEAQENAEKAREAYSKALEADAKLVKPYVHMALLWARENKWQECADASDRALKLNPFDYPQAYFYNAVANLNLQKFDAAEKSAREGLKTEGGNRIPKMKHVLGIVLAQKNDVNGAMEQMKAYLKLLPESGPEVDLVKSQISQLEKFAQNQPPNQQ